MSTTRRVYKIDDATLVKLFSDIAGLFPEFKPAMSFSLLRSHSFSLEEARAMGNLTGNHSFHDARFSVDLGGQRHVGIVFRRAIKRSSSHEEPSARYDEFDLSFAGGDNQFWERKKSLVADVVGLVTSVGVEAPAVGGEDDEAVLKELIRGINTTHRQMLANLDRSLQESIDRRAEIEREADQREAARQEKHEEEMERLADERAELKLQSYRSERRRIFQDTTTSEALDRRRDLAPKRATLARWAVFFAAICLGLISFGITYQSLAQLGVDEALAKEIVSSLPEGASSELVSQTVKDALGTTNWYLIIRSVFSSLVGIAAFAYAASWLRTFYEGQVAAAQAIDRFNYDLVRASWVIETVLEVKQEHDSYVPEQWLEGVTRGLFSDTGPQTPTDESVQALKALLGFTASASFGPEGPKVELNQKGARKLSEGKPPRPTS